MTTLPDNARADRARAFLMSAGWADATFIPFGGDASSRSYARLVRGDETAVFMDAPVESGVCPPAASDEERNALGWNAQSRLAACRVDAFVAIARHLRALSLSAPDILAFDPLEGFALLEDFGDGIFARVIEQGEDETALYAAAAKALAVVHQVPAPSALPVGDAAWPILEFDALALRVNADLFADWMPEYDPAVRLDDVARARFEAARDGLIEQALAMPRALILRDYHAENLVWLPDRTGAKRVGLLDFQDAVNGWGEWDFAMLLQDARREVTDAAREAAVTAYLDDTGGVRAEFDARLAVLGALNALRVAGVFARLVIRDGKDRYRSFQPRQLRLLARNLDHPALADMRAVMADVAPHILETDR